LSAIATIDEKTRTILVESHLIFYGSKASEEIVEKICNEIQNMYNAPDAKIPSEGIVYSVVFRITSQIASVDDAWGMAGVNKSALNNFIRIEEFNLTTRSFMEQGGNSGHWVTTDKLGQSTTAAHEMGHGYGLDHTEFDQRGKPHPDIMAARGTIVDPHFQYDRNVPAGVKGGTVNPIYRRVTQKNIENIFSKINFKDGHGEIGRASNRIYDDVGRILNYA
jgi:hypothetical protein